MKIRITLAGNDRTAIILPVESAGIAASLLAAATIWERDGYQSTSGWKRSEEGIKIEYTDAAELQPTDPLTLKAQEEASKHQQNWYKECTKNQALDKELAETRAALYALRSVTTCTQAPAVDDVVDADLPVHNEDGLPL